MGGVKNLKAEPIYKRINRTYLYLSFGSKSLAMADQIYKIFMKPLMQIKTVEEVFKNTEMFHPLMAELVISKKEKVRIILLK